MKKFLTEVFLLFFVLLVGYFFHPVNVLASSCQVSLSSPSINTGDSLNVSYSGQGGSGDRVDLYVEKWSDGGVINPAPGTVSVYQNVNYYKVATCPAGGSACQTAIPNLPSGNYYVNCNVIPSAGACSGNPFCTYNGGSVACPGWNNCGANSLSPVTVTASCSKCSHSGPIFQETEVFHLNSPSQVKRFFRTDLKNYQTGALPSSVSFSGSAITLKDERVGIAIDNPLKNEPFYKVEVTLSDTNQQNLIGYLTMIDTWWSTQPTTNGFSVGLDTNESKSTYWYWHTQFKTPGNGVTQEQYDWSKKALNKFIKRKTGDVKLEVYVTPNGTYPVVDGANFGSFPDLYIGSYTFRRPTTFNYLVLNKYNAGGDPVTFKDLRATKLDNSLSTVDDVNAYFINKSLGSDAFTKLAGSTTSFNGANGFQNALWVAFLYRGYDYYFGGDHKAKVQQMTDQFLAYLPTYVDTVINSYNSTSCITQYPIFGSNEVLCTNHQYINPIQAVPFIFYAVSDYLRPDQITTFKNQIIRPIDASMQNIKTDGSFPLKGPYVANNPSDETTWLVSFYSGYYANFPDDHPRSDKLLDYIKFVSFLTLSDGKSIRQVYGDTLNFNYLGDSYKDFVAQYIWPTGETDHHGFHPSLNYGQGYVGTLAVVRNFFTKNGVNIPTLSHNLDLAYNKVLKENMNIQTFHLNHPNPKYDLNNIAAGAKVLPDVYTFNTDGSINNFIGSTSPSLVEDWANVYTNYHIIENYGDYDLSGPFSKNVYYSFYSGTGKLFCEGMGFKCGAGTDNFYNYFFSDPLYAMLFSKRSNFLAETHPRHVTILDLRQLLSAFTNIFDYNQLVGNFGK